MPDLWDEPRWIEHSQLLLDSYRHWLGRELLPRDGDAAQQARRLFEAPFVVVSHNAAADPLLTYGNRAALELWEMDLETFCGTPSRLTAEPMHRDERAQLLARTARDGYATDYQGVRISRTGRRFRIQQATLWNLLGSGNQVIGQAATFAGWQFLES